MAGDDKNMTAPTAEIFERNNELADSLNYLETRLNALIQSIDPVLTPPNPTPGLDGSEEDSKKPVSAIANVLTAHRGQAARMSDLINETLERVEL